MVELVKPTIDVYRHAQSTGNIGEPFTAEGNFLLPLTEEGRVLAWERGQHLERRYGPGYLANALLACPPTVRAFETMLYMNYGAAMYRQMAARLDSPTIQLSMPIEPRIFKDLREPDHASCEWIKEQMPWDHVFSSTGDSLAACYRRVEEAYKELVLEAEALGRNRIVIVTSGHVCRLLAIAATKVGEDAWNTFPNPDNCQGYRIGPEREISDAFLRGNGMAVQRIDLHFTVISSAK